MHHPFYVLTGRSPRCTAARNRALGERPCRSRDCLARTRGAHSWLTKWSLPSRAPSCEEGVGLVRSPVSFKGWLAVLHGACAGLGSGVARWPAASPRTTGRWQPASPVVEWMAHNRSGGFRLANRTGSGKVGPALPATRFRFPDAATEDGESTTAQKYHVDEPIRCRRGSDYQLPC